MMTRKRILICDDNTTQYNALAGILKSKYDVKRCSDFKNLLHDFTLNASVHLVILDLGFPDEHGSIQYLPVQDVVESVRSLGGCPVIIFSNVLTMLAGNRETYMLELSKIEAIRYFISSESRNELINFYVSKAIGSSLWLASSDEAVSFIHLSDIHFGRTGIPAPSSFSNLVHSCLKKYIGNDKYPHGIIFTGDASESGRPSEFSQFHDFISGLSSTISNVKPQYRGLINKYNLVSVPGNHDVSWDISRGMSLKPIIVDKGGEKIKSFEYNLDFNDACLQYLAAYAWQPFDSVNLFSNDCEAGWHYTKGYKIIDLSQSLHLVFILINPLFSGCPHLKKRPILSSSMLSEMQKELDLVDKSHSATRVMLCHFPILSRNTDNENLLRLEESDPDNSKLYDYLHTLLKISVVFSGDRHKSIIGVASDDYKILNIGLGSMFGDVSSSRTDSTFNYVSFCGHGAERGHFRRLRVECFENKGAGFEPKNVFDKKTKYVWEYDLH